MKTEKEVQEYLKDKVYSSEEAIFIIGFLCGKRLKPIIVCSSYSPTNLSEDFLAWFESESKEDNKSKAYNQNVIEFEGKPYEFIEGLLGECCCYCDLHVNNECLYQPIYCTEYNRLDKREGYFKLKTIQEKEQPKELKLIPNEFYYCETFAGNKVIFQKRSLIFNTDSFFYIYLSDNRLHKNDYVCLDYKIKELRLATPEEKQMLINTVEKKENKLWNESTKTFEDKPKDILVPESIKITDCKTDGYTLGLLFNNDIQILTYGKRSMAYLVGIKGLNAKYIQCKLIPTLFSEIKAGDIYIDCGLNQLNPSCYHIKLYGKEYAKIYGKKDIQVCLDLPDKNQNVYKVVPVI